MARGWESKAVEAQQEEADKRALSRKPSDELTPKERARRDRLETLRLSKARTLSQLEHATRPAHRAMLQRTLQAIEAEIEELS